MKTTAFLTFIGAASALAVRGVPLAGAAFEAPNTLIQYQRWCPVCETVALNQACIAKRASCQASTLIVPDDAPECSERCSNTCQRSAVADSDYGYVCNMTMPAAGAQ
ncbi:hypothetical protein KVR01_010934 [Diaporthe batatas]|uniref:uncharacterized protein n=1 Tax=Diaporthe batatas TaxID=748121 RepID=UPI001D048611|nr:uncharacterized protein KVR01_010934 [Diaporthe batatas]KAG8159273.1 hypothetical protein KVR01_010934 [Diaporthe batatas]